MMPAESLRRAVSTVSVACLLGHASLADALEWSTAAAADLSLVSEVSGHGILIVDAQHRAGETGPRWHANLNTDTLRLAVRDVEMGPQTTLDVELGGEAFIAGLLTEYWVLGERVPAGGFTASWLSASATIRRTLGTRHFLDARWGSRAWLFGSTALTDPPPPRGFRGLEFAVGYTYWGFRPDWSLQSPAAFRKRLDGVGFGFWFEAHLRDRREIWGARAEDRNAPTSPSLSGKHWLGAGFKASDVLRVQLQLEGFYGAGVDDLSRARVGGMTPYAIQVAGTPWPAFLASRALGAHASIHAVAFGNSELGIELDVAGLDDPARRGEDDWGWLAGGALFGDLRLGTWSLDARVGVTPANRWLGDRTGWGVFVGVGR